MRYWLCGNVGIQRFSDLRLRFSCASPNSLARRTRVI